MGLVDYNAWRSGNYMYCLVKKMSDTSAELYGWKNGSGWVKADDDINSKLSNGTLNGYFGYIPVDGGWQNNYPSGGFINWSLDEVNGTSTLGGGGMALSPSL